MAKRMMVDFQRQGFPQFVPEEEDGMAKPCAVGIEWVNPDTLRTIDKLGIKRTGPHGEPLGAKRQGGGGDGKSKQD
jgi:hypothetical protein